MLNLILKLLYFFIFYGSGYRGYPPAIHADIIHIRICKNNYGSQCGSGYNNVNPDLDLDFTILGYLNHLHFKKYSKLKK